MSVAFPQEIREGLSAALSNVYSWPDAAIAVFQSYVRFGEAVRSPSIATMGAKQNFKLRHYPILTSAESPTHNELSQISCLAATDSC